MIIKAAHIVSSSLSSELVDYIFSKGAGSRLYSADYCLLLSLDIERAFDNANLVLVPVDSTVRPIRRWKVIITNKDAMKQVVDCRTPENPAFHNTILRMPSQFAFRLKHIRILTRKLTSTMWYYGTQGSQTWIRIRGTNKNDP